jgi:hypothetical protein
MTPDTETPTPENETAATIPQELFQAPVNLPDGSSVTVVLTLNPQGNVSFFLDRKLQQDQFGPAAIVEVAARLSKLNDTLINYINARIAEARATLEKEKQPELPLDQQPDELSSDAAPCETGTCCGGCEPSEVAAHASEPQ